MFDWLGDLFNEDTFNTIVKGMNTAGTFFNAASPLINKIGQVGFGIEGTQNAQRIREQSQAALNSLNQLFTPDSPYAKEARRQMERKDAAAGRRSQYGTRETELAANLAKQQASVLQSPAYQALIAGANASPYAPIAGVLGNLTGGLTGQQGGGQLGGQQGGSGRQFGSNGNVPGSSSLAQYLGGLFGPGAEAAIAQGIGGAGSALSGGIAAGGAGAGLGVTDSLGSLLGGNPFLPGYAGTGAEGIFGSGVMQPSTGFTGGESGGLDTAGLVSSGLGDVLSAGLGGAGSALSGMGAGSLAGTVGGADALGGLLGGTGFLPGYAGTGATGIFGGGVGGASSLGAGAGASGAAGAGSAGGGAASAGAGGLGAAAGVALPAAVLLGGLLSMFQAGTQPKDISGSWAANQGNLNQQNFGQFAADDPTLNALLNMSKNQSGGFDQGMFNQALANTSIGGKRFEGESLQQAQQFGQHLAQNPGLFGGAPATQEAWWSPYAQGTPSN